MLATPPRAQPGRRSARRRFGAGRPRRGPRVASMERSEVLLPESPLALARLLPAHARHPAVADVNVDSVCAPVRWRPRRCPRRSARCSRRVRARASSGRRGSSPASCGSTRALWPHRAALGSWECAVAHRSRGASRPHRGAVRRLLTERTTFPLRCQSPHSDANSAADWHHFRRDQHHSDRASRRQPKAGASCAG
jgi:hypothetical protein